MKKLTLNVDTLRVEQFQVLPAATQARGTVRGHETDEGTSCYWAYCTGAPITVAQQPCA